MLLCSGNNRKVYKVVYYCFTNMMPSRDYLEDAKKHEEVFRGILRSMEKEEKGLTVEEIYQKYSEGNRYGVWTILDFKRGPSKDLVAKLSKNEALFASENIATLSGHGRVDKYRIGKDNSVEFDSNITFWMS